MKFSTILFSLAVIATTNDNGVHGMDDMDDMDDMDNTTDTTSVSSDEGGGGFMADLKEGWGDIKANYGCKSDIINMYTNNSALDDVWIAWKKSFKFGEPIGFFNDSESYTSTYSDDTTAAFKEGCEKVDGNTWIQTPDRSFKCQVYQDLGNNDGYWENATVAVTNNAFCLPTLEKCESTMTNLNVTITDFANDNLYERLETETPGFFITSISCDTMKIKIVEDAFNQIEDIGSGGVVTSTNFLGSFVVATAVVAFTVLLI